MTYNKRAFALIRRMVEQGDVCYFEGGTAAGDLLGLIDDLEEAHATIRKLKEKVVRAKKSGKTVEFGGALYNPPAPASKK